MTIKVGKAYKGFTSNTTRAAIIAAMGVAEEQLEIIEAGCIILARVKEGDDDDASATD